MAKSGVRYRVGETGKRPWGRWRVVDVGAGFAVKRIEVAPGHRLSLQRHALRVERWIVAAGIGVVTLGTRTRRVGVGDVVRVGPRVVHRLENPGPDALVLIEVQLGAKLDEADIERLSDDYKRPKA